MELLQQHPLFNIVFHPFSEEFKEFLEKKNDGNALLQKIGFDPNDVKAKCIRSAIKGDMRECVRLFAWRAAFMPLWQEVFNRRVLKKEHIEDFVYRDPECRTRFDAERALIEKSISRI